ncbi:MAG: alpha/beta hydrolase [Myxococcales bacterium]|nr:alpha/beta hydrolase [Myxococcales bacterium]
MMDDRTTTTWGPLAPTLALALTLALATGCPGEAGTTGEAGSSGDSTTDGTPTSAGTGTDATTVTTVTSAGTGDSGVVDTGTGEESGETSTEGSGDSTTGTPGEPGPDLRLAGPLAVQVQTDTEPLPTGCSMSYDLYTPEGQGDAPVVVLAHGFQGNRGTMAGWAEHWASWGVRVVAPDLCHASIIDTDHPQNGDDLRALVTALGLGPVIYAGYSAGGLAAVLAASEDGQAVALLGLDMVDASGLGLAAAPGVAAPAFDIVGEPSMCNTTNNGLAVFGATADGRALRITDADHCDFQSPADFLCGLTCAAGSGGFDDAQIELAVLGLSTAVVGWQSGVEPTGAQWWTPGEHYYEELTGSGLVQEP